MKKIIDTVWDVLVAWGEYRYQLAKKRGFAMYY